MKINILLPHKEMFDKNNASAVSITIKNNLEYSCFRKSIKIYGQETANPISVDNFVGIKNPFFFFSSKNKNLAKKMCQIILAEKDKNQIIEIEPFEVMHGMIKATGYLFEKIAYISDCNKISKKVQKKLMNLDILIIDCLRKDKHPSHFNYSDAINFIKSVRPKKAILTNLHVDLDYFDLKKKLSNNIMPAYDGLSFNF